jgi:MFS family permease
MFSAYRAVFRAPGSAAFCAAGFVMRLPIALYPIALVLLISLRTHHYGFAGVLSGAYVVGSAPGTPVSARLADRFGQVRVLLPATAVHAASVMTLVVLVEAHAPDWSLLPPVVLAGLSYLSVGSLIRARWSYVLAGRPELATAYSLESTLDEVLFVIGPLLATALATTVNPVLPLVIGVTLVVVGALWLAQLGATQPPVHRAAAGRAHGSALTSPGMSLLVLVSVCMGTIFASAELSMVAFCGQHGHQDLSGLILATFAFGSALAGLIYGSRRWPGSMLARFTGQASAFALLPTLLLTAGNLPTLAVVALVVGLGIAPMLITAFGLIAQIVPERSLTEGLAWLITGLSVGYGIGAVIVGRLADRDGAHTAFSVSAVAGLVLGGLAWLVRARLVRAR